MFEILEGNVENAFDIIKRVENGMYVGEYRDFTCFVKSGWTNCKYLTISAFNLWNTTVFPWLETAFSFWEDLVGFWVMSHFSLWHIHMYVYFLTNQTHMCTLRGYKKNNDLPWRMSGLSKLSTSWSVLVFALWWHHGAVIIFMGALGVFVFWELSSEWLFETDESLFLSRQIFGINFHSLVVKQSTI